MGDDKASQPFNSSVPFCPTLPYDAVYKERVPLLHAFEVGLANCLFSALGRRPPKLSSETLAPVPQRGHFLAAECGVFQGMGLAACAELAKASGLLVRIYGLDTFAGLPELGPMDHKLAPPSAPYLSKTLFADTSLEAVKRLLTQKGVEDYAVLVPGLFEETLRTLPDSEYFFVDIDCDLYDPHIQCLEFFYPRVPKGGIIFFDDYHSVEVPMARRAIDEFMRGRPEMLFHLRYADDGPNQTKTFMIKF